MIDANRFRRGHPEQPRRPKAVWHDWTTLRDEGSLQRPLSQAERICIAVAHAEPTHSITLTSKDLDHEGAAKAFAVWLKQINRRRSRSYPFIYFGTIARSKEGEGGAHIHLLAWEFLREDVGQGQSRVSDEATFATWPIQALCGSSALSRSPMPVGQHESVFGSTNHRSNEPLPKNKRAHLVPQASTIAQVQPQLLSGLELAKDRSVSDIELLEALPILVRGYRGKRRSTGHGGSRGKKTPSTPTGTRGASEPQTGRTPSVTDGSPSSSETASEAFTTSTSAISSRTSSSTSPNRSLPCHGCPGAVGTLVRWGKGSAIALITSTASGSAVPRCVIQRLPSNSCIRKIKRRRTRC